MTATQMQWKRSRDELVDEIRALGFPDELGQEIAKHLGSPKAMRRMVSYLQYVKPKTAELIVDEDDKQNQSDKKTAYKDNTDRIGVERFFSLGKRCNGMGLITTRLEETSVTVISLSVLVTNLFRHTNAINFFVFYLTNETDDPEYYFALFDIDEDELEA